MLADKERLAAEKDLQIASLSRKLDTLIAFQNQMKLDIDSWLAKERQWNKECQSLLKTISDLQDQIPNFHTLLATCHARGISRSKYLKNFYHSLVKRRTDYENMLPVVLQCS